MVLETAHPVKFPEAVENGIGIPIEIPAAVQSIMNKEKRSVLIKADFKQLNEYLVK
jgi:threonine synthase